MVGGHTQWLSGEYETTRVCILLTVHTGTFASESTALDRVQNIFSSPAYQRAVYSGAILV